MTVSDQEKASEQSESTVNTLINLLRDAAEIEQQFMCMYLYGAYSVKKRYVEGQFDDIPGNVDALPLSELSGLEEARRWVSVIYSVARQEMEHLALVNNMLRAVGAAPYFSRINIQDIKNPQPGAKLHIWQKYSLAAEGEPVVETSDALVPFSQFKKQLKASASATDASATCTCHYPIEFDFDFTSFTLEACKAWTCMESPGYDELKRFGPELFADWCFSCQEQPKEESIFEGSYAGKINALYEQIRELFRQLSPSDYIVRSVDQVSIIQQYDIYVFPVTDFASASQAIDLIVKQGEGNDANVDYQSHYRRFFDIATDYPQTSKPLYWTLLDNPLTCDISENYPNTRAIFDLSNEAYELLVIILTALYALPQNPTAAPYLAPALKQEAFAPMMTMIIRSISELLVQLKAGPNDERVASSFELSDEVNELLLYPYIGMNESNANEVWQDKPLKPEIASLDRILNRFKQFNDGLQQVELEHDDVANTKMIGWAKERLAYIKENSQRIQVNLSRINQVGIYRLLDADE